MRLARRFSGQFTNIALVMLILVVMVAPFAGVSAEGEEVQVYVGHRARLSAEIPADWTVPADGTADYSGSDGFVYSSLVAGDDLEATCRDIADTVFTGFGTGEITTWNGDSACQLEGKSRERSAAGMVLPLPMPIDAFGQTYRFAAILADPNHFPSILGTVSFDSADVTPQDYIYSVLDIMEARAWYAPEVDWDRYRTDDLGLIENARTYEETHWVISDALASLRAWGDNHSFFLPDASTFTELESTGTGMLLDGRTVHLVYPDSPAGRADIRAGDTVVEVNGEGFNGTRWIDDLLWTHGTITISRPGEPEPITVEIEPGPYSRYLPPIVNSIGPGIGYVELFSTIGADEETYVEDAISGIDRVDDPTMCGWIVDLRRNGGGSYGPMVMGVEPILGDGELFSFQRRDGATIGSVHLRNGRFHDGAGQASPYPADVEGHDLATPNPPVAVLIGPGTASAGELTAVAFIGRPDSRLFGDVSGGFTIGNNVYSLFDGSTLALAESTYVDRTGGTHIGGIEPDVTVTTEWETYGTPDDPVVMAASSWLREHPSCRGAAPVASPDVPAP